MTHLPSSCTQALQCVWFKSLAYNMAISLSLWDSVVVNTFFSLLNTHATTCFVVFSDGFFSNVYVDVGITQICLHDFGNRSAFHSSRTRKVVCLLTFTCKMFLILRGLRRSFYFLPSNCFPPALKSLFLLAHGS